MSDDLLTTKKRCPYEVLYLLRALHSAAVRTVDSRVTCFEPDEMYVVLERDSMVSAFAMLWIGFSYHASLETLYAEEESRTIRICVTGTRRRTGDALTYRDILPAKAEDAALLDRYLARNCAAYEFAECDGTLSLCVSLPRFLTDNFDMSSIEEEETRVMFYDVLLHLAGEAPKHPLPD